MSIGDVVGLEGWLVIIDYKLFVIPENYSDNYVGGEKVEISSPEIMFSVIEKILPLGGESFIFHRAKAEGEVEAISPVRVKLTALSVEERGEGFVSIDVHESNIEKYRPRYERLIEKRHIRSGDWLDYV